MKKLWVGAVAGAGAYVVSLLAAVVLLLLVLVGTTASGSGGNSSIPSNPFTGTGSDASMPSMWSMLFPMAAQLVTMGMLGTTGTSIDATVPFLGPLHGSGSVFAVPFLLTAISIAALLLSGWFAQKKARALSRTALWAQVLTTGIVFSLVVNVVAAIAAITFRIPGIGVIRISAAGPMPGLVASVVGAAAAFAGHKLHGRGQRSEITVGPLVRDAFLTAGAHLGVFSVVAVPIVVIVAGIKAGWAATLSAPLWAPTAGMYLFGLGHLGALGRTWDASSAVSSSSNNTGSEFGYGPGTALTQVDIPGWTGWLLVLLALVSVLAASVLWRLRSGAMAGPGVVGWLYLPGAFLVVGIFVTWLSTVSGTVDVGSLANASGSLGLAAWTPFLLLVWGAVTEAASRYVAPHLIRAIPADVVSRLVNSRTRDTVFGDGGGV